MSGNEPANPPRIATRKLIPAARHLVRTLRFLRRQRLNGDDETLIRRSWLLAVVEFLDTILPDLCEEGLTLTGTAMATDLEDQLQRKRQSTGRARVHPAKAVLRLTVLGKIDALTRFGMHVTTARGLLADALANEGVTTERGQRITRRTLEDWAEWFERQPDAFDGGRPDLSIKQLREAAAQDYGKHLDAGVPPELLVEVGIRQAVVWSRG